MSQEQARCTDGPGSAADRRTTRHDWHVWMLGIMIVMILLALGVAIQANRAAGSATRAAQEATRAARVALATNRKLARVEANDRRRTFSTAFRLCTRGKVDRAFAHSRVALRGGPPGFSRFLEGIRGLPILNCAPNLRGLSASPLSPRAQRAFTRRWAAGRVTGAQAGICPDSRIGVIPDPSHC